MYCVDAYQYKLIWLPLSDLTGPTWMKHRRVGCEIVEEELPAMRGYHRVEEAKTEGCMADGLRCNIWARAQIPKSLTYSLMKGGNFPGLRRGACALQLTDVVWKPGMQLARPQWRIEHPILDKLGAKLVHFLVDYHHDWFQSLELPASDGKHKQLGPEDVQDVLNRLETIQEVHGEVQVFSGVKIEHSQVNGAQIVHCSPFKSRHANPRMVSRL